MAWLTLFQFSSATNDLVKAGLITTGPIANLRKLDRLFFLFFRRQLDLLFHHHRFELLKVQVQVDLGHLNANELFR